MAALPANWRGTLVIVDHMAGFVSTGSTRRHLPLELCCNYLGLWGDAVRLTRNTRIRGSSNNQKP